MDASCVAAVDVLESSSEEAVEVEVEVELDDELLTFAAASSSAETVPSPFVSRREI
jgi:hypothetical protein